MKRSVPARRSNLEETLMTHFKAAGLSKRVMREVQFAPPRKWKFDFCFPYAMLAVEVEGGIWTNGRHSRGAGMEGDMEKYNEATLRGYSVLRFSVKHIKSGEALAQVERFLNWHALKQGGAGA
jgi:very-short-patch-repair endonuclease